MGGEYDTILAGDTINVTDELPLIIVCGYAHIFLDAPNLVGLYFVGDIQGYSIF